MKNRIPADALKYAAILLVSLLLAGFVTLQSPISWPTLFKPDYTKYGIQKDSQYDTNGMPVFANISSRSRWYNDPATGNPNFLAFIMSTLPERKDQSNNPALFPATASDDNYNLYLNAPAKVEVSFVYEGAGYRSSLGYFTFDPDSPPAKPAPGQVLIDKIIFPNSSLSNSGGSNPNIFYGTPNYGLKTGDTVSLGTIDPAAFPWNKGKNCSAGACKVGVGFVLVADGFQLNDKGFVNPSPDTNWVFYSLKGLNPETSAARQQHTVLVKDPATGLFAIGFEDSNREKGSDSDFNDVVFRVKTTPESAITNIKSFGSGMNDSDGDGIPDALDEFPNDKQRASSTWYPSKTGWNTLAFEDSWPYAGDYDMNDLVLNYRYRQILRADGTVKEIEVLYQLAATGAANHDGFALELTGIPLATPLDYATLKINGGAASDIVPVPAVYSHKNTNLVFRIFNDAYTAFGLKATDSLKVNTVKGGVTAAPVTYQLNVAFTNTLPPSAFIYPPPYNPFLSKTNSVADEIHLPGYAPTSAADTTIFGTGDDNTGPAAKRYYVSKAGYPWALNIPGTWKWPAEGVDMVRAYPDFKAWAVSLGAQQPSWYANPTANAAYIY